ncbi:hypothetical protein ILUMI_03070 [Ignelater luminosus]|uniref:Protein farnesyltransferase subunit beta n=1 Tax=Ignelater luminosus TaxID=2038154 RepID=A0A8K0DF95_IGNLU|nr:hypothetical protein ILUMI_03070 [Ignelater luminosus]
MYKMFGFGCSMAPIMRNFEELKKERFNEENENTITSEDQIEVERTIQELFRTFKLRCEVDKNLPKLLRWEHVQCLKHWLMYLPPGYKCLDASRTWICYWILHSLTLLEVTLPEDLKDALVDFIGRCQSKEGGFGGGPGQMPHLATTYAAVNSLCIIGNKKAYDIINREALQRFLCAVKTPEGAFSMHRGGEVDIRGVYCALSVATLTNVFTECLFEGTAEWVISCQTYEGGFSGCPGMEAHGGYAFCGLASLLLLNKGHLCDVDALLRWTVNRQMRFEGGFQGRTNKLVDGCYSFWQGGAFPLIHSLLIREGNAPDYLLFNQNALQEYILVCCQHPGGGLLDKPGKPRDIYHTCYTLSGLSVAQHCVDGSLNVLGPADNKLGKTHPIYNIGPEAVLKAASHFSRLDVPQNIPPVS